MIPEGNPYNNWSGNGSTTTFDFDFYIEDSSQLEVYYTDTSGTQVQLTEDVDYTINEVGNEDGSYITFPVSTSSYSVLKEGEVISLVMSVPITQEEEYTISSKLNLEQIEYSLDKLTRICQVINRKMERSVKIQEGSESTADELLESISNARIVAQNYAEIATEQATTATEQATEVTATYAEAMSEIAAAKSEAVDRVVNLGSNIPRYNAFCINTGGVDDSGNPTFLTLTESTQTTTDEETAEETTTTAYTLTTSGSFDVTTANGTIYTISDTLEYTADNLEDGTYKIFIDPVNKSISLTQNEITYGSAFPSTAVSGDYLLNISQVPYDLQKLTDDGITKGLNEVYAGVLTVSGEGSLSLNTYNENIILTNALTGKADIDLSNLSETGQAVIDNKADVDLSNLTDTGTSTAAGYAMPSSTYTSLTLGSSGSTYTAPADGYFCLSKYNGSDTGAFYIALTNNTAGSLQTEYRSAVGSIIIGRIFIPAHKGDTVTCNYDMVGSTIFFRFIYAVGSV